MVQDRQAAHRQGVNWLQAQSRAQGWQYNGRQGRLAIIDSPELYDWIRTQFMLNDNRPRQQVGYTHTWIGLRYWCGVRELIWVDGSEHRSNDYAPWDTPWHSGGYTCSTNNFAFMGVYLSGETHLWQATGPEKRWRSYIVEYPER